MNLHLPPKMLKLRLYNDKQKWMNSTLNCEAYSSFEEVSSDHKIILTRIHLSVHRNKKQKVKKFDGILPQLCNTVYKQNSIEKWIKVA